MKKFLAGLVSLALVFAVCFSFAACGKGHRDLEGKTFVLEDVQLYFSSVQKNRENTEEDWTISYGISSCYVLDYCKMQVVDAYNATPEGLENPITSDQLTTEQLKEVQERFDYLTLGSTEENKHVSTISFKDGKMYVEDAYTITYQDGSTTSYKTINVYDYQMKDGVVVLTQTVDGNTIEYKDAVRLYNNDRLSINNVGLISINYTNIWTVRQNFITNNTTNTELYESSVNYFATTAVYKAV